jgi:ribosomal protein S18 acetylase RimI-like enzyme
LKPRLNIQFHQITHWQDPILPDVLDLYQVSFPPNEQNRLSWWVRLLNELSLKKEPARVERLLYAVLDESNKSDVLGFTYCEVLAEHKLGYLMYLATREDLRGQGVGASVYQRLLQELFTNRQAEILVFEVETPSVVAEESPEKARFAERRIAWYERQGARLLEGTHYVQSVGWQPAVEMYLMFQSRVEASPADAFAMAKEFFGDSLTQISELAWTNSAPRNT